MYELILQLILMFSLAIVVYLMAVAVPRVKDAEESDGSPSAKGVPLERLDSALNALKDKLLRRLKVWVMRTDNFISRQLNNKEEKL